MVEVELETEGYSIDNIQAYINMNILYYIDEETGEYRKVNSLKELEL